MQTSCEKKEQEKGVGKGSLALSDDWHHGSYRVSVHLVCVLEEILAAGRFTGVVYDCRV